MATSLPRRSCRSEENPGVSESFAGKKKTALGDLSWQILYFYFGTEKRLDR